MIKNFLNKISQFNSSKYYVVYKNRDDKIKTYLIGSINLYNSFSNKKQNRDNAGFKAYCFARNEVRSFRHDRIVSLTKK
jgi:hypothetical protein